MVSEEVFAGIRGKGELPGDYTVVRVPNVGLTLAALSRAPPAFGGIDGLEEYLVRLGEVPAVAHTHSGLFTNSSQ